MRMFLTITAISGWLIVFALAGCTSAQEPTAPEENAAENEILSLPALEAADLNGEKLMIVATTSIIGDVVRQVGGDAVDLVTLMAPGQDPHSFVPAAQDLTAVAQAHAIFVNGWDLEESLVDELTAISEEVPMIPVSAKIEPLEFGGQEDEEDHENEGDGSHDHAVDPHTWQSVKNVMQWVRNIEQALSSLDPAQASIYQANATAYLAELAELDGYAQATLAAIPAEKRLLVTNHNAFGYFARDYAFQVLGTIIPGASTLAEPSASSLADLVHTLQGHQLCTLFTETTMNSLLAETLATELTYCTEVQVIPLYTGSIGPAGSGADSYLKMFRYNVGAIATGLK